MKSIKKVNFNQIGKALCAAFHEKEKTEVGELWQSRLMDHIRSLGPLYSKTNFLDLFQRFVWQLAPFTCVLILLLSAAVVRLDFVSDYELSKMFIEDPTNFSLLSLYNK